MTGTVANQLHIIAHPSSLLAMLPALSVGERMGLFLIEIE